jgi:hypothetical protein
VERTAASNTTIEETKDVTHVAGKTDHGWMVQLAIPWSTLNSTPSVGRRLSLEFMLNDADTSHERFRITPVDAAADFKIPDPSTWSLLELTDAPSTAGSRP